MPWLLGSSEQSAIWAGELGLRYAFADFINPSGAEIATLYRERFAPVRDLQAPRTAVAVWVLAAPDRRGGPVPGLEQPDDVHAAAPRPADPGPAAREGDASSWPARAPDAVRRHPRPPRRSSARRRRSAPGIEELATDYQADEVIVVTITYDHGVRRRSYELLAEAFDLEPRALAARAPR